MGKDRFTVMLRYNPRNAEIHQKVIDCLARLDPNASKQLAAAGFTGRLILRRRSDPEAARRLKQLFEATGAACDVLKEPISPAAGTANGRKAITPSTNSESPTRPSLMQCPKCGLEQPSNPECRVCGIVIAKAVRHRVSPPVENATAAPPSNPAAFRRLVCRVRRWSRPARTLIRWIQHPIAIGRLTSWSKKAADRLIRCGIVFAIALLLEICLLAMGKMLWSLYVATAMGKYYLERLPEQAQEFQRIAEADPLALGLDVTAVVFGASLLVACAAQILHLTRYLYESQGIIGKLMLWFAPCTGLTAWIINQRPPFPELALAGTLTVVPTLCMLSSCLRLGRIILPEIGDLRVVASIIMNNRDAAWELIMKKIRIWFNTTKRVC
jgi:hypothetical protein